MTDINDLSQPNNYTPAELELAGLLHNAMTLNALPGNFEAMVLQAMYGDDAPDECRGAAVQTANIARNILADPAYWQTIVEKHDALTPDSA